MWEAKAAGVALEVEPSLLAPETARRGLEVGAKGAVDRRVPDRESDAVEVVARLPWSRRTRLAGALVDLWTSLVPPEVASRTEIIAMRGSILNVRADSSSVAFDLDRRLRSGLLAALRERSATTLTRVKVTVGAPDA